MALDFVAGCLGGGAGVLAGYPLDTVKVKIQTQEVSTGGLKYKGTLDCLIKLVKKDGARSLYKGLSSPLLGVAGINAITFGAYGSVLRLLPHQDNISSITLAGASAGLIQSFIVSPMELIKTQMQVCGKQGISEAVAHIYNTAGLRGLTRGLAITFTREVPAFGVYFGSYELMIRQCGDSTPVVLTAGGLAGILSWVLTYPQDVIKSRLQADGFGEAQQYRGSQHCLRASLRSEGPGCLVRGMGSTIIRAFPMNAVTFGVYSYIMKNYGYTEEEAELDTLENLVERLGLYQGWEKTVEKPQKLSTLATDGPNIVFVQEPLISPLSQARLYPEQMLWACPGAAAMTEESWQSELEYSESQGSGLSNYCNFNQFTQRAPLDDLYTVPEVVEVRRAGHQCDQELEPSCPSLLCEDTEKVERWRTRITTHDFLIPTNLLSYRSNTDRIYGFYYIVA